MADENERATPRCGQCRMDLTGVASYPHAGSGDRWCEGCRAFDEGDLQVGLKQLMRRLTEIEDGLKESETHFKALGRTEDLIANCGVEILKIVVGLKKDGVGFNDEARLDLKMALSNLTIELGKLQGDVQSLKGRMRP